MIPPPGRAVMMASPVSIVVIVSVVFGSVVNVVLPSRTICSGSVSSIRF
jgi:hypothetical protein